ncbi:MAG: hypothetical protein V4670_09715 [Bacteroidota bacterium]
MKNLTKICLLLLSSLISTSCYKKEEIFILEKNIDKPQIFKYPVDKKKTYTWYKIIVKGRVNDTIKINHYKLKGEIDTVFRCDYYGGDDNIYLKYIPYRATKGNLKIIHYAY